MRSYIPWGYVTALIIWLIVFSAAYLFFENWQKPKIAIIPDSLVGNEVVIPRSWDGHYYVRGELNGYPVDFMVDTGASIVSISYELARAAKLPNGRLASFSSASGKFLGEIVSEQDIKVGGILVKGLSVGIGMEGKVGLLGQNFLRRVEVIQSRDKMILRVSTTGQIAIE
ncbi:MULTISPECIES: retropepsin-like aspartic protease family protein [Nitrosomonas]|uniref:Aspartyl protease n=1 Tax=Nitrosomonas communis TaxID=44574 RepID=A0A0F7KHL1_9PROT|nr:MULTISPECIES: TIGR02281 family clan AA aspartic protease [Nitrosomonas]AKH38996.1 aspartyl protease [Nitrosomonas communis]TYP81287.1 aspartyl protease family protein [Nitrosomonas communis]UVS61155.1 TIGR02281 family clan AA aspartic protease [Nitrosomonas sp. PLL12]